MNLKRLNGHSVFKITSPLEITISYLVVLALSSGSLVQLKGLFDQPSLPLPLSLRVMGGIYSAVALISTGKREKDISVIM